MKHYNGEIRDVLSKWIQKTFKRAHLKKLGQELPEDDDPEVAKKRQKLVEKLEKESKQLAKL